MDFEFKSLEGLTLGDATVLLEAFIQPHWEKTTWMVEMFFLLRGIKYR